MKVLCSVNHGHSFGNIHKVRMRCCGVYKFPYFVVDKSRIFFAVNINRHYLDYPHVPSLIRLDGKHMYLNSRFCHHVRHTHFLSIRSRWSTLLNNMHLRLVAIRFLLNSRCRRSPKISEKNRVSLRLFYY